GGGRSSTMGGPARSIGIAIIGAACACNALTGADALDVDPSDEASLPTRRHETSSAPVGEPSPSSSSGGGSSGTTSDPDPEDGGAPIDAGPDGSNAPNPSLFFDDFQRPESATVGNGWIEKVDKFAIVGGAVRQAGIGSYRDMIVRRPASEDLLDV